MYDMAREIYDMAHTTDEMAQRIYAHILMQPLAYLYLHLRTFTLKENC